MVLMSYIWSTEPLSLSMSVRSEDPPSVITAPMFLEISSYIVHKLFRNQSYCGSHSCSDEQVTFGHVCSSFSVGVHVVTPSIVPFEDNGSIK